MKYRVIHKKGIYYPQQKILFWWFDFYNSNNRTVLFFQWREAKDYILSYKKSLTVKKETKVKEKPVVVWECY